MRTRMKPLLAGLGVAGVLFAAAEPASAQYPYPYPYPYGAAPAPVAPPVVAPPVAAYPYLYGGRRFCWYDDAWNGAGWYWCGYAYRAGFGWGGPVGWNGWARGGGRGWGGRGGGRGGYHHH